ncbi:MAG TPA: sigma-70 family RNA polymerase sigma factor [bacterium]|nr:sigma-70 family RNA polymerase sigma factor [bacterium]HPS30287.1 sigma-70 family RNA polymerase sigma factor [bacterium]
MFSDDRFYKDFRNGNQAVLFEVYKNYAPKVANFLYKGFIFKACDKDCRFSGYKNNCDLVNAVQLTFEKAFTKNAIRSYDGIRPYETYLFTIAKNVVVDDLRKKRIPLTDNVIDVEAVPAESACTNPERKMLIEELKNLMAEFTAVLEPLERDVLKYRFTEGFSQDTTAEVTGLTRTMVRTLEKSIRLKALEFFSKSGYLNDVNRRMVVNIMLLQIFKI